MNIIRMASLYIIPVFFIIIVFVGLYKGVDVFETFIQGARNGIPTVFRIIPPLVGLMVAIGVFRASGALDLLVYAVKPLFSFIGVPEGVIPLALLRPVSGSASLAMMSDIIQSHGPDSMTGRIASTVMGSTETTFYTLTVYFGAVGTKDTRYTLAAALLADTAGIIFSVWVCTILYG